MIISFISINSSYETQEISPAVNHTFGVKITIVHWLQNASNQGWLSLLDKKLCPLETIPCFFKEIGQVEHTGQSKGNVNK